MIDSDTESDTDYYNYDDDYLEDLLNYENYENEEILENHMKNNPNGAVGYDGTFDELNNRIKQSKKNKIKLKQEIRNRKNSRRKLIII